MKKIIGIVCASLGSILLSAALAFGVFTLIKNKNVAETGNVLGVSWYNETDRTFTITTVEELYEFAELSKFYDFKGQTIKLDADLVVNEGNAADWAEDAPAKKWKPINDFAGTFDGQGHTISGLYAKVFGAKLALFTNTNQSCTIKNMKLVNSYFESNGLEGVASFASTGGGKFYQLYSDAILECRGEKVAGLMSMVNKPTKMEECWFDGAIHTTNRDAGGLIDDIYQARVELKHCLFSGTIDQEYTIGGTRTGSICGKIREKGSLIMNDCLATGTLITSKTVYSGALVGVVYSGCQIVTTDCYISSDVYHLLVGDSGEQGTINGRPLQMPSDVLVGTKAYEWTTLNFDKYWAAVEGGTPVLKCFGEKGLSLEGVEKAFDVSWYMPGTYIYEITTLKQLYGLYYLSGGNNFAEHTIKLGADIVVNEGKASNWEKKAPENQWFAINKFAGIFDGQGHTISGVYLNNEMTYQGLFGQVEPEGIVRNLSIKNSYFCNDSDGKLAMMGSVAGEFRGKLENVYSNAIVTSSGTQVGGIFGRTNDNDADEKDDSVVITNCWFDGEVRMKGNGGRHAGGFIGMVVQGDLDISHCLNTGICSAEAVNIGVHLGGFIGNTMNGGVINMTDCLSAGKIEAAYKICVGSVFGRATNEERIINLSNVYATKESYGVTFYGTGEGGVTSAEVNGIVIMIPKKLATGISAYQWTYLDFAKHWAIVQDGTPILKTFAKSAPSVAGYEKMINLDWYKHDKKTYTIKTTEELYGFALLTCGEEFIGKTVQLGADIVVNSGDASTYATTAPEKAWLPIGSTSAYFKGTFDGQGHTISGLYLNTEDTYGGLFAMTGDGSIVKNFRLTNSYFCYSGTTGALLGSVIGDMFGASTLENVYSNAIVVSQGQQAGGLVGRANDKDTESDKTTDKGIIRNCWFDGNFSLKGETTVYGGGIVGRLFRGDLDIEHCLNTGTLSSEAKDRALQFGGIIGAVNEKGTFNLSDSLNVGTVSVTYHNGAGSVIGRVSCTNQDDRTVNVKDTYGVAESYKTPFGSYSATSNINGVPIPLKEKFMTGYTAYQWTSLDFADNWAIVEGDTPILQNFASSVPSVAGQEKMIDLDWYKASAKTYEINTAKELRGFAVMACGDTFKGKTVMLKDNIDLEEEQWISVGSELKNFSGTFDGQGKTISGLKIDTKEYYGGLFGIAGSGSVIKNFRLTDSDISYSGTGGAILGSVVADLYGGATLENVYSNATVVSCGEQAGGLVGRVNDKDDDKKEDKAIISNCWYAGKFSLTGEATVYGGGIVGRLFRGDLDIEHCLNTGSVSSEAKGKALQLGGFVGAVNGVGSINVRDSLNIGALSVKHDVGVGSVIGRVASDNPKDRTVNITDTYASADSYKIVLGTSKEHISKGGAAPMPKSFLTGYTAYQWTSLDFEDRWAVVEDGTPVLQTFASKVPSLLGYSKLFDLEWYDADASKFELKTEKELRGLALISATDDFNGKTITLEEDMDLKDKDWLPIGSSFTAFAGTFDGQMKTIKGVHVDTTTAGAGLFGIIASAGNVANFYLTDSTFKSTKTELGSVAGYSAGTISTVYSDADIVSSEKNSGGIVGKISNSATVEKCWFAGDIELSGAQGKQSGGIAGYVANAGANVSITDCLYTGNVIQTYNTDRLIGYCVEPTYGFALDFVGDDATWSMRKSGVPIPKVFESVVGEDKIVADLDALSAEIGLEQWNKTLADAVDFGMGNYVISAEATSDQYSAYLKTLGDLGFELYANNEKELDGTDSAMKKDGVYNAIYTKADGDWVLNITFVQKEGKIYISISTISKDGLDDNLLYTDENIAIANATNATTKEVSFSMLELQGKWGNSFVFKLPNGHFIINDGGKKKASDVNNLDPLLDYLQELAESKKVVIDAWIFTHSHDDHMAIASDIFGEAEWKENVSLNAIYLTEANYKTKLIEGASARVIEDTNEAFRGLLSLTQDDNKSKPAIYRMHMGERYYFSGLTMDVVQAHEQIAYEEYDDYDVRDGFNTTSTNCVYTLTNTGKKILIGGDSNNANMQYMMEAYGKNYTTYSDSGSNNGGASYTLANINYFVVYHHGKNAICKFEKGHVPAIIGSTIESTATNQWANYLLHNVMNDAQAEHKFDAVLFPWYQVFDMKRYEGEFISHSGTVHTNVWGGDDGSIIYPYNISQINQYYIDNSHNKTYYTYGYQDHDADGNILELDGLENHGTVRIIFKDDKTVEHPNLQ